MNLYYITAKLENHPGDIKKMIYADGPQKAEIKFYDKANLECYITKIDPV